VISNILTCVLIAVLIALLTLIIVISASDTAVIVKVTVILEKRHWRLLLCAKIIHINLKVCILLCFNAISVQLQLPVRARQRVSFLHVKSEGCRGSDFTALLNVHRCSWRIKTNQNIRVTANLALVGLNKKLGHFTTIGRFVVVILQKLFCDGCALVWDVLGLGLSRFNKSLNITTIT